MSIEAIAAASAGVSGGAAAAMPPAQAAGGITNFNVADITGFQGAMGAASPAIGGTDALGPAVKAMFTQLEKVNGEAKGVADYAKSAELSGNSMTPGEVVNLTMKCHEFMFHCQLTSNIANRTSDGIQQLFRQQS